MRFDRTKACGKQGSQQLAQPDTDLFAVAGRLFQSRPVSKQERRPYHDKGFGAERGKCIFEFALDSVVEHD
ncbi:hypothetical protein WL32_32130 [Burkholderia cepacia]|nr:hypothetical protein WI27_16795 [Burkholderia cepacia]KWB14676.1 hypothetical protein WL32_32130 [Burkholderia cepacia]